MYLGAPAAFAADPGGVLSGKVFDNDTKEALAGADVVVTSPALQTPQIVKTDSSGFYRVPGLPPGEYYIQFDKEGYNSNGLPEIALRASATLRIDAPMSKGEVQAINLTTKPNVDIGSSSSGTNLDSNFIKRVPLSAPAGKGAASRSFESLADVAPGTTVDTYGTGISGASSPENNYSIDGLSVGNPAKGTVGTQLSTEFVDEVNVVTSGYLPEYGRTTGGVLRVTTKSGSNEFHGSVFSFFSPGALEGDRKTVQRAGQPVQYKAKLDYIGDVGFDLGGPIIKNKLWFYTGFDAANSVYSAKRGVYRILPGVKDELGNDRFEDSPVFEQKYQASSRVLQGIVKLTWAINADHRLTLSAFGSPLRSGGGASFDPATGTVTGGRYGINPLTGRPQWETLGAPGTYAAVANQEESVPIDATAKLTSQFLGKRLLLDVTFGVHHQQDNTRAVDGSSAASGPEGLGRYHRVEWNTVDAANPHNIAEFENLPPDAAAACGTGPTGRCNVGTYLGGAPSFLQDATYNRYHSSVIVTYLVSFLGHHLLKAGFDGEFTQFKNVKSNRVFNEGLDGETGERIFSDNERFGVLVGPDMAVPIDQLRKNTTSSIVGGFLQDSWSVMDKVAVNLGLRYDAQFFYNKGKTVLSLPNQWSPRLGLIYDPTQSGRSKLFANYARYYQSTPLDFADVALVGEPQLSTGRTAATCNPAIYSQQINQCQQNLRKGLSREPGRPNKLYGSGGTTNAIDPDIEASSSDEVSFGGEYELLADARAGVTYTRRWINKWIEDTVPNVDLPAFDTNPGYGLGKGLDKVKRDYDAITVFATKTFSRSWLAQASYTFAHLKGNYAGLFASEDQFLGPSFTAAYDNGYLMKNRNGLLPGDIRHSIKAVTSKDWQITPLQHLGTGLVVRAQSGGPTNYLGTDLHSYDSQIYILPRGAGKRLPWQFTGDIQLSYRVAIASGYALSLTMDVFNAWNWQKALTVDENYTYQPVLPDTNATKAQLDSGQLKDVNNQPINGDLRNKGYGYATSYTPPRIFRFGLRGQF